jgi:signal transduction histidine kinase
MISAGLCQTPAALIGLIEDGRQRCIGRWGLRADHLPDSETFCDYAARQQDALIVADAQRDPRFAGNRLIAAHPPLRYCAGVPLRASDGTALGALCVFDHHPRQLHADQLDRLRALARQVTSQLELDHALALVRTSNEYRGRLMAIAGHDLRTPLRAAVYALEKLRRGDAADPAQLVHTARAAMVEVGNQLDDLAALAGSEGAVALPTLSDLPLEEVLHPVALRWQRQAEAKGLRLRTVASSLVVHSHRALLSALVGNLVGNAVKYTPRGSVLLGVRRRAQHAVITVADTGIGMDPAQAERMFGAFQQADPLNDGLGLGLWIVRRTAETLGAPVQVRSLPGRGSCLTVAVPLAGTHDAGAGTARGNATPA